MATPINPSLETLRSLLRSGHALTYAAIRDRVNVETRQARRLLNRLRDAGLPIQERRTDGHKEFFLPDDALHIEDADIPFSERQALALLVAVQAARPTLKPTPLAKPLDKAKTLLVDRLRSANTYDLEDLADRWSFERAPLTRTIDTDVFDTLLRAVNEQITVAVDYYTASTKTFRKGRRMDPLLLGVTKHTWVCAAFCHRSHIVKDFALHRMSNPQLGDPAGDRFTVPDDFDPDIYFRDHFGGLAAGEPTVVRLLVEPEGARYIKDREHHPTQLIEEERDDGRLVVSFEMAGLKGCATFVRSWGPLVTVLSPPELIDQLQEEAAILADRYATRREAAHVD